MRTHYSRSYNMHSTFFALLAGLQFNLQQKTITRRERAARIGHTLAAAVMSRKTSRERARIKERGRARTYLVGMNGKGNRARRGRRAWCAKKRIIAHTCLNYPSASCGHCACACTQGRQSSTVSRRGVPIQLFNASH